MRDDVLPVPLHQNAVALNLFFYTKSGVKNRGILVILINRRSTLSEKFIATLPIPIRISYFLKSFVAIKNRMFCKKCY